MVWSKSRLSSLTMARLSKERAFPTVNCVNEQCPTKYTTDKLSWVSAEDTFMCQTCGVRQMPKQMLFSKKRTNELTAFGIAFRDATNFNSDKGLEVEKE